MLSVHCEDCDTDVLLGIESISAVQNAGDEIVVRFECTCGASGVRRFGKRRRVPEARIRDRAPFLNHRPRSM